MSILKSLTFTAPPKTDDRPVIKKRERMIARLEEQKKLLADPNFIRAVQKTVRKDGEKSVVEKTQRVTPWWQMDQNGSYVFMVRAGTRVIEFEKGKSAIAIPSLDKLPAVIDTLVKAVRGGELDTQLLTGRVAKPSVKKAA
jgi:hypothetical protein